MKMSGAAILANPDECLCSFCYLQVRVYEEFSDGSRPPAPAGADTTSGAGKRGLGWLAKRRERKRLAKEAEAMQHLNEDLSGIPYKLIGTLTAGQYFGEYSCMLGEPRIATVVTTSLCELYRWVADTCASSPA
jgi:hypothetical protein